MNDKKAGLLHSGFSCNTDSIYCENFSLLSIHTESNVARAEPKCCFSGSNSVRGNAMSFRVGSDKNYDSNIHQLIRSIRTKAPEHWSWLDYTSTLIRYNSYPCVHVGELRESTEHYPGVALVGHIDLVHRVDTKIPTPCHMVTNTQVD